MKRYGILKEIYRPLIQLLEAELGRPVSFFVTADYPELGGRLGKGAADMGIFGPKSYVDAMDEIPGLVYLATCMQPTANYHSLLLTLKDTDIHCVEDLKGKSFGFTSRLSTSGYVYPMLMLGEHGIEPERDFSITFFLEKHDKVFDALARGSIRAGAASSTALARAKKRNGDVFRVIQISDPIPRNAVTASPHLDKVLIQKLVAILKAAGQSPYFLESSSILKEFVIKDDSFYDIVRKARDLRP